MTDYKENLANDKPVIKKDYSDLRKVIAMFMIFIIVLLFFKFFVVNVNDKIDQEYIARIDSFARANKHIQQDYYQFKDSVIKANQKDSHLISKEELANKITEANGKENILHVRTLNYDNLQRDVANKQKRFHQIK